MWRSRTALGLTLTVTSALVASCSSDPPTATIGINVGQELDAFTRQPAPTSLLVESIDLDGKVTELSRTALPADEVSLGDKELTDVASLRVTATDAAGKTLLKGQSLYVQFGALASSDFSVFVQRVGELARLPNLAIPLDQPRLTIDVGRYIFAASDTTTVLYDLLLLGTATPFTALPRPARSLATFGTVAVIIDEKGASSLDLSSGTYADLAAPAGGTFAEISGGASVVSLGLSVGVIGGTRPAGAGGPTPRVFRIAADGTTTFATLATPREGACAANVEGRGIFVYGGTAEKGTAELLAPGAAVGSTLAYPADPVKGCGAAALDATHVLVVGGVGTAADPAAIPLPRVIDLACTADCVPATWPGAVPLVRAEAVSIAAGVALVVGDDAAGATHAYRVTGTESRELTLREPRRGARLIALPNGAAAIAGGAASVEQYVE
ncbi:MAG: hypothetical protein JWP97_4814 [Labilithrix sp.]|nr:hypothetical protein [Labilithrix sp.]